MYVVSPLDFVLYRGKSITIGTAYTVGQCRWSMVVVYGMHEVKLIASKIILCQGRNLFWGRVGAVWAWY